MATLEYPELVSSLEFGGILFFFFLYNQKPGGLAHGATNSLSIQHVYPSISRPHDGYLVDVQ